MVNLKNIKYALKLLWKNPEIKDEIDDVAFAQQLLGQAKFSNLFSVNAPIEILTHLKDAQNLLNKVEKLVASNDHGGYFKASTPRYLHYWAAAMALPTKSKVLDVGSAPGHVGIGLNLLGMEVVGVNLNEEWRSTYPSLEWVQKLGVIEHDFEQAPLPYADNTFDAVYFAEVLEHIAIKNPLEVLSDLRRVLKPDGMLVLSTPNLCNISNIYALLNEVNIFWSPEIFYGSLDRHNREYTPKEVYDVVEKAGFTNIQMYGINSYCNWRSGTGDYAYKVVAALGDNHPLLRNTIVIVAKK
ncbi:MULTISPECIES: class I SAM-dependent methyltransferase [Cyanophyceae]|uniref:class I SAM-dependent methyltransferase n=1 Tax=Cyanophyceae TaxID=3028117 RepID=UPI001684E0B8|nr:class I SAM-dependent methyltransferase [Trichocoleus sp. FACHB-40]MBD2004102.1 class I SAM-dependent methyltransferase [Trichocoleus sp. FACHB-40]